MYLSNTFVTESSGSHGGKYDIVSCSLIEVDYPDDGGSTHLQNVGLLQQYYMVGSVSQKAVIVKSVTIFITMCKTINDQH
jgi:hypothetical protein